MQFAYGATRWVILFGRYAIKIARLRPLRPVIRLIQLFKNGESVHAVLQKYEVGGISPWIRYLLYGIVANRAEYALYKKFYELRLARPIGIYFWGLILIQERGEPIYDVQKVESHPLWARFVSMNHSVREALKQFCLFDGIPYLVDYGEPGMSTVLEFALETQR